MGLAIPLKSKEMGLEWFGYLWILRTFYFSYLKKTTFECNQQGHPSPKTTRKNGVSSLWPRLRYLGGAWQNASFEPLGGDVGLYPDEIRGDWRIKKIKI